MYILSLGPYFCLMKDLEQYKSELLNEWQSLRDSIDTTFYYLEEEDFSRKEAKAKAWNLKEVLYHINLLNRHFLDQIEAKEPKAKDQVKKIRTSFYARSLMKTMPYESEGQSKRKYRSPKKVDPVLKQKQGYAIVSKVVFADLLDDLESIKSYIENLGNNGLLGLKVKALIPFFSVYGHEALGIMIRHERRHIAQAKRILNA